MTQPPWMLTAPIATISEHIEIGFVRALEKKDASVIAPEAPVWLFLKWLSEAGFLLHGSPLNGLKMLHPQPKDYDQPDEFSNRIGVYATDDPLWSMMYALRSQKAVGQMDMCLKRYIEGKWTERLYYYALGSHPDACDRVETLMSPGRVYVLPRKGFERSPPYQHGSLGWVQEFHYLSEDTQTPLMSVPVKPRDFPLPVHVFDKAKIDAKAFDDPWGFPWL